MNKYSIICIKWLISHKKGIRGVQSAQIIPIFVVLNINGRAAYVNEK